MKTFTKCSLMRAHWTHGGGSDVRRKDAACLHWKGNEHGMDAN